MQGLNSINFIVWFPLYSMRKLPRDRPQAAALQHHTFIRSYDDGNKQIIAEWVCHQLQELRLLGQANGL